MNDPDRVEFESCFSKPPFEWNFKRRGEESAWPGSYLNLEQEYAWQGFKMALEFCSGNSIPVERATVTRERMIEILAAAIEADRQARGEPVLYQSRTRPIWVGASKNWTAWENCTKDQANDYKRVKVLHDWEYDVRELYAAPQPQQIPEGWQLVPKEPTSKQVCLMSLEIQGVNENGVCRTDDPRWPESVAKAEATYQAMLAAAPQPENAP